MQVDSLRLNETCKDVVGVSLIKGLESSLDFHVYVHCASKGFSGGEPRGSVTASLNMTFKIQDGGRNQKMLIWYKTCGPRCDLF